MKETKDRNTPMILKSFYYYISGTLSLIGLLVFCGPVLLLPARFNRYVGSAWVRFLLWQLKIINGLSYTFRGTENIRKDSVIYASKHQSAMETLVLGGFIKQATFVVKRELFWIPVFGWFLKRSGMIGVNRSGGAAAILDLMNRCKKERDLGRPFVIFPEGTRRPVLSSPKYKAGIYRMYKELNIPVVPIAHNAGVFWAKQSMEKKPGMVVFEFLPAIETGLSKEDFMQRLVEATEEKSNALAHEAIAELEKKKI